MTHYDEQPDGDIHGECAAEIERLTKERDIEIARNRPLHSLIKTLEETHSYLLRKRDEQKEAVNTLASEREANEQLTNTITEQAERIAELERSTAMTAMRDAIKSAALEENERQAKLIAAQSAALAKARDALDRLARLGNGQQFGNSVGNIIAQDALAAIDALKP